MNTPDRFGLRIVWYRGICWKWRCELRLYTIIRPLRFVSAIFRLGISLQLCRFRWRRMVLCEYSLRS